MNPLEQPILKRIKDCFVAGVKDSGDSCSLGKTSAFLQWWTPSNFAAILALLIILWYPEVIFGQATFYFRDFGLFGYPLAHYHRECFWRGEIPLWNPYNYCGIPFMAQWNTMTFYPPTLFYLVFPLSWSLGIFCLAHMFWAGLGMYFLIRHWNRCLFAASIAGIGFACNGLMWNSLMWPNNIAGLSWMPWVLLFARLAWTEGGSKVFIAGLIAAMQMMTGAPEIILLTWIILASLWLCGAIQPGSEWGVILKRRSGRFLGMVILCLGLAAVQLLPFMSLLSVSQRDASYGGTVWSMPGTGWANFILPLFATKQSLHNIYFQSEQYWTSSYYMGIGILALALVSIWNCRRIEHRVMIALTIVGLIVALGENGPLLPILKLLFPEMGFIRFPIKYVILPVFLLPLLAGLALGELMEPSQTERKVISRLSPFLIASACLILLAGTLGWFAHEFPMTKDLQFGLLFKNSLVRIGLLIGMVALLVCRVSSFRSSHWFLLELSLVILLWLDIRLHNENLNPTISRSAYEENLTRDYLEAKQHLDLSRGRAAMDPRSQKQMHYRMPSVPENDYLGRRLALVSNINLIDRLPTISGFYSLYGRSMYEIISTLSAMTDANVSKLLDFMNVAYENVPDTLMDWRVRPHHMPLATIGQKPVFLSPQQTLNAIFSEELDFNELVLLPEEAKDVVTVKEQAKGMILSSSISNHSLEFEIDAKQPAILVIAQSDYPSWRASVNFKPAKIWRANYGFQALEVPAGRSSVRLVYRDKAFFTGMVISLSCLMVCLFGMVMERHSLKRQNLSLAMR